MLIGVGYWCAVWRCCVWMCGLGCNGGFVEVDLLVWISVFGFGFVGLGVVR